MGEIGISRREFLYELSFWELRRIVKGYRRRDVLQAQLLRLTAYSAAFAVRDPKGKGPLEWFPLPFDNDEDLNRDSMPPISEEEARDLQAEIAAINRQNEQSKEN